MPTKIYDPTPLIKNDIVEIAKSSIDEVTNRLNLRVKEISIQITCFKTDGTQMGHYRGARELAALSSEHHKSCKALELTKRSIAVKN